jgi:hypothetical protein
VVGGIQPIFISQTLNDIYVFEVRFSSITI